VNVEDRKAKANSEKISGQGAPEIEPVTGLIGGSGSAIWTVLPVQVVDKSCRLAG
jgi:hypothetical protein